MMEPLDHILDALERVSAEAAGAGWEALPALCAERGRLVETLVAHPDRNAAPPERMRGIMEQGDALEARVSGWRDGWRAESAELETQLRLAHELESILAGPRQDFSREV
jgi:hypothetical protein